MSVPSHLELKLIVTGRGNESAVVACLRENGYTAEETEPVQHLDAYLDTFDWLLLRNKMELRYRVSNGTAMYTVAAIGPVEEGVERRGETEVLPDGPVEVPTALPVKRIRKRVEDVISPRKLIEQVRVRTRRTSYRVVSPEGAEIELLFENSICSLRGLDPPRSARRLNELSAGLLKGPAAAMTGLSSLLTTAFDCLPSAASKLEAAIERLRIQIPSKKASGQQRVRPDDRVDVALRKILGDQIQRFRDQIPGVKGDIDTEFVHQARVATRRMRSALRCFRGSVAGETASYLQGELKWLALRFGAVRDVDVFLLNLVRFKPQMAHFPARKRQVLENWIRRRRRESLAELCEALESARYTALQSRLTQFLERSLPSRPRLALARRHVHEVAPGLITERFDAVIRQGRLVLEKSKLTRLHRLRIRIKRLRYACEFMASAYNGALDPFIERTVELQDCLGEIQDTVFTRRFVDSLRGDWEGKVMDPDLLFILGEIYQLQADMARRGRETFDKIWERFSTDAAPLLREIFHIEPGAE
jgi:CHAD domain-containing protein